MSRIARSVELAAKVHNDQKDRAGQPYILHPLHVMATVDLGGLHDETEIEDVRCSAVLHDVIEDWHGELSDIRSRVRRVGEDRVLRAVEHLTRREGEPWDRYIARVTEDWIARRVKLADLAHNMDLRRLQTVTLRDEERNDRYRRTYALLRQEKA